MPLVVPMPGDALGNAAAPYDPNAPANGGLQTMGGLPFNPNQSPAALQQLQQLMEQTQLGQQQLSGLQSGQQAALQAALGGQATSTKNINAMFPGGLGAVFSGLFGPGGLGGALGGLASSMGGGGTGGGGGAAPPMGFQQVNGPASASFGGSPSPGGSGATQNTSNAIAALMKQAAPNQRNPNQMTPMSGQGGQPSAMMPSYA